MLRSSGWRGSVSRLVLVTFAVAGLYAWPTIFQWYAELVWSAKVEIKGYGSTLIVANILLGLTVLYELINGIRFLRSRREKKREHEEADTTQSN